MSKQWDLEQSERNAWSLGYEDGYDARMRRSLSVGAFPLSVRWTPDYREAYIEGWYAADEALKRTK